MSNRLSGLCKGCIDFYSEHLSLPLGLLSSLDVGPGMASAVPREFMSNSRILDLITTASGASATAGDGPPGVIDNLSSTTSSILGTAVAYQESASTSRIGVQVHKGSTKSEAGGLARFKNLRKSEGSSTRPTSILAERRNKKAEWVQQQSITGPKFSVTLWKCRGVEAKPKQVWTVCLSLPVGLYFKLSLLMLFILTF
jgi:hypothetical protein